MIRAIGMSTIKSRSVSPQEKKFRFQTGKKFGFNLGSDHGTFRREEEKSISGFGAVSTVSKKTK